MTGFSYDDTPVAVGDDIADSHRQAWDRLGRPGTWWTGRQRLAIAARARALFAARATPPWLRQLPDAEPGLDGRTTEIVDRVAVDAGRIDRSWANAAIADIGDGHYVELVAVVATVVMVDVFAEAVGVAPAPLPRPVAGEPSRTRPDGLGDIGATCRWSTRSRSPTWPGPSAWSPRPTPCSAGCRCRPTRRRDSQTCSGTPRSAGPRSSWWRPGWRR